MFEMAEWMVYVMAVSVLTIDVILEEGKFKRRLRKLSKLLQG
jgi:hypothetical protein